jgi:hypothetical protein
MGFLTNLFKSKNSQTLREKIIKSIDLYINYYDQPDTVQNSIAKISESEDEATKLFLFIPLVFCRIFIPEVRYSDFYITLDSEGKEITNRFSECPIYNEIMIVSKENFEQYDVMKILFYSGDFKAINDALKNGATLENLESVPSRIL